MMKIWFRSTFATRSLLVSICVLPVTVLCAVLSCVQEHPAAAGGTEVQAWRNDLLELAADAASAMPVDPHLKTRSRLQEAVAATAFAAGLPLRGLRYVECIENWRRGSGYADYAAYLAEHGAVRAEVDAAITRAMEVADADAACANAQMWRRDRVRAKVARTLLRLGDIEGALRYGRSLSASEVGIVQAAHAATLSAADVRKSLEGFDEVFVQGDLAIVRGMLESCVSMLDAQYGDPELRAALVSRIRTGNSKLPQTLRIQYLLQASSVVREHGGHAEAAELAAIAGAHLAAGRYLIDDRVRMRSRIAAAEALAGGVDAAVPALEDALVELRAAKAELPAGEDMFDLERTNSLRAIAEGFVDAGRDERALAVYAEAVEAGLLNPNARPRAEALVAICCSLITKDLEPNDALKQRLRSVADAMGDPW